MRRHAVTVAALCLSAGLASGGSGRADEDAPSPAAAPAAGALKRAPSAVYLPLRAGIEIRSAPSPSAPVVATLPATAKPLPALGMALDEEPASPGDGTPDATVERTWIRLRLPSGGSGFARLSDLVTPQQAAARVASLKKAGAFAAEVATAKRVGGADVPSGIYTRGGSCDAPLASETNVGGYLQSKVLIWQDGSKMHFVRVLRPDDTTVYDMGDDRRVQELRGYGYVPMRTFRSSKDAVLMGFKDHRLWYTTNGYNFDSYEACDPGLTDTIVTLLRSYAAQRPPEAR